MLLTRHFEKMKLQKARTKQQAHTDIYNDCKKEEEGGQSSYIRPGNLAFRKSSHARGELQHTNGCAQVESDSSTTLLYGNVGSHVTLVLAWGRRRVTAIRSRSTFKIDPIVGRWLQLIDDIGKGVRKTKFLDSSAVNGPVEGISGPRSRGGHKAVVNPN
jgi:hypothetical protein